MSITAQPTGFPLPELHSPSIFSYNTTTSIVDDTIPIFYSDDDYLNSTLGSAAINDTLLDALSRTVGEGASDNNLPMETILGVFLALLANTFVGISLILKKQSLKKLKADGETRASEGGFGYLKAARWWLGFLILAMGESLNFVAYIFAPAILVTPLGVFSIVVTAILSPYFLKESVGVLGRIGCVLIIIGCVIVTLCGPKDQEMTSMDELEYYLLSPGFLIYTACVVIVASILMYLSPKYGAKYISINVCIVGAYSSVAIMFAKGIGIGIKTTIEGENAFTRWSLWFCFFGLIHCLTIELIYSQRSLDLFNSSILMSITYVVCASLIILLSTVLFSNSRNIGWKDTVLTIAGFIVNIAALYIMNFERDPNLSLRKSSESINDVEGPAIPPLEGTAIEKSSGDQHLYEIRRDSPTDHFSTPPSHTPKMTPMKMPSIHSCTLPNISAAMFRENGESNSCLSLISETPSSKNNFSKDRNSLDSLSDKNSQTSSHNRDNFRRLDMDSAGNSSSSLHSSCSSRRSAGGGSKRRQEKPDEQHRYAADGGTCLCGSPLIPDGRDRSQSCPDHPPPDSAEGAQLTRTPDEDDDFIGEKEGTDINVVMEVKPSSGNSTNMNNSAESIKSNVQKSEALIEQSVGSN